MKLHCCWNEESNDWYDFDSISSSEVMCQGCLKKYNVDKLNQFDCNECEDGHNLVKNHDCFHCGRA